jgi:phosphate transport system substrate-binding protein
VDQVLDHLAADRHGIAYVRNQKGVSDRFQVLDIAKSDGGPYVKISLDSVYDHTYPLYDEMFFYVDRKPGTKMDPKVREFLRYVLSREGQEAVEQDGKYLPLTPEAALAQLKKLEN